MTITFGQIAPAPYWKEFFEAGRPYTAREVLEIAPAEHACLIVTESDYALIPVSLALALGHAAAARYDGWEFSVKKSPHAAAWLLLNAISHGAWSDAWDAAIKRFSRDETRRVAHEARMEVWEWAAAWLMEHIDQENG